MTSDKSAGGRRIPPRRQQAGAVDGSRRADKIVLFLLKIGKRRLTGGTLGCCQ